jgi:hypothetical protein
MAARSAAVGDRASAVAGPIKLRDEPNRIEQALHRTGPAKLKGVEERPDHGAQRAMPLDQFGGAIDGFRREQ